LRDRDLVRLYWPVELRSAFDAVFAIDDAMADVVVSTSQPALGAIRLAWWREALERLDSSPPPAEPRLEAAARELLPRGISGKQLAALEDGWASLVEEVPDFMRVARRGQRLFTILARLLKASSVDLDADGRLFAGVDAARRGYWTLATAKEEKAAPRAYPRAVRPITALAVLAARDVKRGGPPFEVEATPGRAFALLFHRWTGRL
jgi:phytoene synthase